MLGGLTDFNFQKNLQKNIDRPKNLKFFAGLPFGAGASKTLLGKTAIFLAAQVTALAFDASGRKALLVNAQHQLNAAWRGIAWNPIRSRSPNIKGYQTCP